MSRILGEGRTRRIPRPKRTSLLSRRATRIFVVAGVLIVLILSLLSAIVLIEGARNPDAIPSQSAPAEQVEP